MMMTGKFTANPRERKELDTPQEREKILRYLLNSIDRNGEEVKVIGTQIGNAFYVASKIKGMENITSLITPLLVRDGIEGIALAHNQSKTNPDSIVILQHYAPDTVYSLNTGISEKDLADYQDLLTDMVKVSCISYESSGSANGLAKAANLYRFIGIQTEADPTNTRLVPDSLLQEYLRQEKSSGTTSMPRWDIAIKFAKDFLEKYGNQEVRNLDAVERINEIKRILV